MLFTDYRGLYTNTNLLAFDIIINRYFNIIEKIAPNTNENLTTIFAFVAFQGTG